MRHRADIDGLRAIAVVPVVLFHAGISQVSGGFVGVDIFFVISGYLITSLILGEMAEGRFSLAGFYERRIRRIFPALFAVLAVCVVLAGTLLMPRELQHFDQSLLAATFFVSNIYFYATTGYFAAQPDSLPLLHTWSLSIEEQFYIVFPLLLSVALRFGRRVWVWLIAALFLLSLAASIWVTRVNPDAAFYLAPMRVWELMLGALLAARLVPRIEAQAVREMLALAGVALIAYAVFRFSPATPFPGSAALIPCLGVTVSRLLAAGKTVVLVYPVPEIGFVVPPAVGRLIARGGDPQSLNLPLASFMQRQDVVLSALDHAGTSQRIFRVYPHKRLCNATECLVFAGGRSLYRDDDHLSSAGVDLVLPEFGSILEAGGGSVETAQTGRRH